MALSIFHQFHKHPTPDAIKAASTVLANQITASSKPSDALNATHWDLLEFSHEHPPSIDYALRIYDDMARLLPSTLQIPHHTPSESGARTILAMFLADQVRSLNPLSGPDDVGERLVARDWDYDGAEYANVTFARCEVAGADDAQLGKLVAKVLGVRALRRETVIAWAVLGRAQALGVVQTGRGGEEKLPRHFGGLLCPSGMGHGYMSPWSKADFVAGCVGIRAAARTYLDKCSAEERDGLLKSWKEGVAEFLLEDDQATDNEDRKFHDGDFHIKYHAAPLLLSYN